MSRSSVAKLIFGTTEMLFLALMVFGIMNAYDVKILRYSVLAFFWINIINAIGSTFVETIYPGSIRAILGRICLMGDSSFAYPFIVLDLPLIAFYCELKTQK